MSWRFTYNKQFKDLFFLHFHSVQGQRATRGRVLQRKSHSLCTYVGKITVNSKLGQVKTLVIREVSYWESVQQSNDAWEEVVRVEFTFHQGNTKAIDPLKTIRLRSSFCKTFLNLRQSFLIL